MKAWAALRTLSTVGYWYGVRRHEMSRRAAAKDAVVTVLFIVKHQKPGTVTWDGEN